MKKGLLFTMLLSTLLFVSQAEDTVRCGDGRYYCGNLPEIIWAPPTVAHELNQLCGPYFVFQHGVPTYLCANTNIYWSIGAPIYGVAAWLKDVECEFNAILYQVNNGIVTVVDTCNGIKNIKKHEFILNHKIEVYTDSNNNLTADTVTGTFPVVFSSYEFFFDSAINVLDTFFIGIYKTVYCSSAKLMCASRFDIPEQYLQELSSQYLLHHDTSVVIINDTNRTIQKHKSSGGSTWIWSGIFPIIVPDTDTTDTTDSTGIGDVWTGPDVTVLPNPTSGAVTVRSSAPLRMVEAYDVQGRRLVRQQASGTSTKLNLAGLRRGCYILEIHTAAGTTHKKLVIR